MRLGVFGPALARPLEIVDAFLADDIDPARSESEARGTYRVTVVEATFDARAIELIVCIPPRRDPEAAFREVLAGCDAAIVAVAAGGWREQEDAIAALGRARRDAPRVPFVGAINEFVPPRLDVDPEPDAIAAALDAHPVVRGRVCWWRHEKTGTDVARAAVRAALLRVLEDAPDLRGLGM